MEAKGNEGSVQLVKQTRNILSPAPSRVRKNVQVEEACSFGNSERKRSSKQRSKVSQELKQASFDKKRAKINHRAKRRREKLIGSMSPDLKRRKKSADGSSSPPKSTEAMHPTDPSTPTFSIIRQNKNASPMSRKKKDYAPIVVYTDSSDEELIPRRTQKVIHDVTASDDGDDYNHKINQNHNDNRDGNQCNKSLNQNGGDDEDDDDDDCDRDNGIGGVKEKMSNSLYERLMNRDQWIRKSSAFKTTNRSQDQSGNKNSLNFRTQCSREVSGNGNSSGEDSGENHNEHEEVADGELNLSGYEEEGRISADAARVKSGKQKPSLKGRDNSYELTINDVNEFEEGEKKLDTSDDFDGEYDPLLKSVRIKRELRAKKAPSIRSAAGASLASRSFRKSVLENQDIRRNMKEEWETEYHSKEISFFNSPEARLEIDQDVLRLATGQLRATSYLGVRVNEKNNSDILFIYETAYKSKERNDRGKSQAYHQFLVCMGQIARAGAALQKLELTEMWKKGEFFKIAGNSAFFRLFIDHFSSTSTPATVMCKEAQLIKFVSYALTYFGLHPRFPGNAEKNNAFQMRMVGVLGFLRQDRTVNKTSSRQIRQRTKEDWHRASVGKFVSEEMFDLMRQQAIGELRGLKNTFYSAFEDKGAQDLNTKRAVFSDKVLKNEKLLMKWNINFVALLLMFGNGQRNQVYTFLKCPSISDVLLFEREHGGSKASVPLKISIHEDEKRVRDSRLPFIMLDPIVYPYIRLHALFVQPFLLEKHQIKSGTKDSEKLLLDTRSGKPFTSDNVRYTLSSWIRNIDNNVHITPMDLRASYATIMIRRHAQRSELSDKDYFAFQTMSEEEFITMLACVMNTGTEQLRQVYAASSHSNYADHVARVMNIVQPSSSGLDKCEGYSRLIA